MKSSRPGPAHSLPAKTAAPTQPAPALDSNPVLDTPTGAVDPSLGISPDIRPTTLIALQRVFGNQSISRMITRSAPIQRAPTQVSNAVSDGPYGWTASYEVVFAANECKLSVKAKLAPDAGVSAADLQRVKNETAREYQRIFDNRFKLTETGTANVYNLRVGLVFVDTGEHLTVNVHSGSGRDDLSNWYVDSEPIDRAHEMGHQLGLKDEYVDPGVANRQNAGSPGVSNDHSIMGNYYEQGIDPAEAKLRHGQTIAGAIGAATGRTFDVAMNTTPSLITRLTQLNAELASLADEAARAPKTAEKQAIEAALLARTIELVVHVRSTEDWLGADEVFAKLTSGSRTQATTVVSLNNGQSHTFAVPLLMLLPLEGSIGVRIYDEDWPDGDDLIVDLPWASPFNPTTSTASLDDADYQVTARFRL